MNIMRSLSVGTGLSQSDLEYIIKTAPARYKVYSIPKRGGGQRTIAHPSRELKAIQRIIVDQILSNFPVHQSAMAYVKGRNIRDNARVHIENDVILKLDFVNFFNGIFTKDWLSFASQTKKFSDSEIGIMARILFWGKGGYDPICLSVGAPSSPTVSNILLYKLDSKLHRALTAKGASYTRYADDITISGPTREVVLESEQLVRYEVANLYSPTLRFNDEKRGLYNRAMRRMVTGLVITPVGEISLGRSRKRKISAMLHQYKYDRLDVEGANVLRGLLGFALANEPDFVQRMRRKYGDSIVDGALRHSSAGNRRNEPVLVSGSRRRGRGSLKRLLLT